MRTDSQSHDGVNAMMKVAQAVMQVYYLLNFQSQMLKLTVDHDLME